MHEREAAVLSAPASDQRTGGLCSPVELIGSLAAIVPPKGFNGGRYHDLLAPRLERLA